MEWCTLVWFCGLVLKFSLALCTVNSIIGRVVRCGAVWCGAVWCGAVWCGVVWCGVVRYGITLIHNIKSTECFVFISPTSVPLCLQNSWCLKFELQNLVC